MHSLQSSGSSTAGEYRRDSFTRYIAKASIDDSHAVLRDTGASPRVGTPQRNVARVHNGRAPKEMWCRRSATLRGRVVAPY